MKSFVLGLVAAGMFAGLSYAQTTTSPNTTGAPPTARAPAEVMPKSNDRAAASGNNNQAVATTNANALEPAKGANSFTMGEAKSRLEQNGFTDVSDLKKDDNGVWRGTGKKGGAANGVWLDYKGNTGIASK